MTDYEASYAALVLLYVMECCVLAPESSVLFTRVFSRWRVRRNFGIAFPGGKRLVLLPLFPWAGEWHSAPSPDSTCTALGVLPLNSLHEYPQGIGKAGLFGESAGTARPGGEEAPATPDREDLAEWTDPAPARAVLARIRGGLPLLRVLCGMQALWAFAGAPLLLAWFSPQGMVLPYLFILYWLGGAVAVCFAFTYRKAHGQRGKALLKAMWIFLYPLAAMRAVQSLSTGVLPARHESALAKALMRDDDAAAYLADSSAKLRHRLFYRSLTPEASRALGEANERLLEAIHRHWGVDDAPALHDPARMDPLTVCYCPVCGISLLARKEACPHCLEVRTVAKPA